MRPQLVIFDMDGTMLDTEPTSVAAMQRAGKAMGGDISPEICDMLMGKSLARCREILKANFGEDFDTEKAFRLHREYMDEIFKETGVPVKPGIFELLNALDANGIKKCVATSTEKERALHKLADAGLVNRFETITGGDEVENGKPAPDIFLKAAKSCGAAPSECIVIEDTEAGILGATAAKIRVIAVPDIAPLSKEIRAKAVTVCADLFEVAGWLGV